MISTNEILVIALPVILAIVIGIYYYERTLQAEKSRQKFEHLRQTKKQSLPIQLQAYERLILYLERIHPDSLIPRSINSNDSLITFQNKLIRTIREEFEHNLSQQLYVSNAAWLQIVKAKESLIHLINVATAEQKKEANALDLGKSILQAHASVKKAPTSEAIILLKEECKNLI